MSKCPEILVSLARSDYLQSALVDSGAMANICPYQIFEQLNLDNSKIVKLSHNLSLIGTTGSFNDAIMGVFTTNIYCLLKKQTLDGTRVFGHSRITFLVTKKEVELKRLILGMPWQKSCKVMMDMSYPMTVEARLKCDSTEKRCSLQLKESDEIYLEPTERLCRADTTAIFYINSIFLEPSLSLKVNNPNNKIILPRLIHLTNKAKISRVHNYPLIQNTSVIELPCKILSNTKKKLKIPLTVASFQSTSNTHQNSTNLALGTTQPSEGRSPGPTTQPSGNSSPKCADLAENETLRGPENLSFDEIHDAVNFLSLPEAEQNSVVAGPQVDSQIPSTTDEIRQVYSAEISEKRICTVCFVYETH